MKKRKISFLLNICTICLAVVAIVIGVYSLKQAKLNIGGLVGFKAHNLEFTATGTIKGHSNNINGEPITTEETLSNGSDGLPVLGNRFFSDLVSSGKPGTIIVTIKITNNSSFNISAKVN